MLSRIDELIAICVEAYGDAYEVYDERVPETTVNSIDVIQLDGMLHTCGTSRIRYDALYCIHFKTDLGRRELQELSEEVQYLFEYEFPDLSVKKLDSELFLFMRDMTLYHQVEDAPLVEELHKYICRKDFK